MKRRWVLTIIVLIGLGSATAATVSMFRQARQSAQVQATQAAREVQAALQTTLHRQIDATTTIRAFEATLPPERAFQRFAHNYLDAHPDIDALGYIDARDGRRYLVPATTEAPASVQKIPRPLTTTVITIDPSTHVAVVSTPLHHGGMIGAAQSLFDLDAVMTNIQEQIDADLAIQIEGANGELLWAAEDGSKLLPPMAEHPLEIEETEWTLKIGWRHPPPGPPTLWLIASWMAFLLILGGVVYTYRNIYHQARQLHQEVKQRTAELTATETRYRILAESLPLGLFIYADQQVQFINRAMAKLLHLQTKKNPTKISLANFMKEADYEKLIARLSRGDPAHLAPWHAEITRADDSTFLGEITAIPLRYQGQPALTGMLRDITKQANAHTRLQNLNQIHRAIMRINHALIHTRHSPQHLLQQVCQIVAAERGYDTVWIANVQSDQTINLARIYAMPAQRQAQLKAWFEQANRPRGDDGVVAEQAIQQGENVIALEPADFLEPPITTAAFPIWVHDEIYAIFNVSTTSPQAFAHEEELGLLHDLATDIGLAMEHIQNDEQRRKIEEALHTSEERFRRLAEYAAVGVVLVQDQRFRYANPAFAEMFDYESTKEIRGQLRVEDCIAPDDRQRTLSSLEDALSGNRRALHFKFEGQRKDGTCIKIEVHGARAIHARRPALLATIVDITEQERLQRQLKALSHAGLTLSQARTFNEAMEIAIQQALNIVSAEAANIFALQGEEISLMKNVGDESLAFDPDVLALAGVDILNLPTYQKMLTTHQPLIINDTTESNLWKDAWTSPGIHAYIGVPLIVRGKVIGFLNVDSTQPHRFESEDAQRLHLFADYVAATIENLRLITSLEAERNRLAILNELSQTLAATLSLSIQEVGAQTLEKIAQPLHSEKGILYLWDKDADHLRTLSCRGIPEAGLGTLDEQLAKPDICLTEWVAKHRTSALAPDVSQNPHWTYIPNTDEWVKSALIVPLEVHGELVGVLSLLSKQLAAFDEKDLQLVEALSVPIALALQNAQFYADAAHQAEMMAEALAQQEELDRMKDELIQNISHELRTPLSLVYGYAMMLQQGELGELPPMQANAVAIIARRSQMLRELVENMTLLWKIDSTAAKGEAPEKAPVDLGELAPIVVEEFQTSARENHVAVALEHEVGAARNEAPLVIAGVPLQIQRMLDNLLGNAMKFTPEGGRITVKLAREDGQHIRLAVCDTGIGIPPEKQEKIFDRFYQVDGSSKRQYGGVGLGLALVKSIVQTHGGRLWVKSPVTDDPAYPGTCMIVSLPLQETEFDST